MLIYQKCGCGCEVRPVQIGGAHNCACAPKFGRARCVRASDPKNGRNSHLDFKTKVVLLFG